MIVLDDRTEMAEESGELTLDAMFEALAKMPVPEGTKVEIVGGNIFMSPQRQTHFEIVFDILQQLYGRYPRNRMASDVRIDFPGHLNGFACDAAALAEGAVRGDHGRWRHQDVEFVAEVISQGTASNDYGPKKTAYALAEVPVYLVADPYQGRCHLYTQPKDGEYTSELSVAYGGVVDMTDTPLELAFDTAGLPRD
ncbi:Uma2 family endonuclease [Streptomyces nodosus]|uniref:Uma2 family endonuclease n=1 Tax=Streptomyces nodosus TaxID=40318 RepID=UPI003820C01F